MTCFVVRLILVGRPLFLEFFLSKKGRQMTIHKARSLLGDNFTQLSDLEIKQIIYFYQGISGQIINSYFNENSCGLKLKIN